MTVLLTHGYFLCEDQKEQQIMRPYAPLGLLYIAGFLEQQGITNDVFDTTFSTRKLLFSYLNERQPSIVGIYTNLMTRVNVLDIIRHIRSQLPDTHVILGGPEVTEHAEQFLRHGADWIIIGEAEETMLELVNYIGEHPQREAGLPDDQTIAGTAFLKNDVYTQSVGRQHRKDLDTLPRPAREKIEMQHYLDAWKNHHGESALSVSTMRGCPYTCKWCCQTVFGLSYRRRSAESVADELQHIKSQYNHDYIWFVDDVFTISRRWLTEFHDALECRKLRIRYECITRSDRLSEEVMSILKSTGCFRVWIGAESGSQKVIDLMDRRVNVQQVRDMIQLAKRFQIEAGTFIMLGYPGETEKDIKETINHLKLSEPDHYTITVVYPIKGTDLYQEVEATQTTALDWSTSSDRQIEFRRTYQRRYYYFAVSHVVNEVNYHRQRSGNRPLIAAPYKIKSAIARVGMWLNK
jgi:radical SAM superfamily enzyme YgiQ (UPF0313 family)